MSLFPGLCGDAPALATRVFLGVLPSLTTEKRLNRQLQTVFPWFQSRRRVKEFAQEFVELDLASVDAETMLRYSHVFYVRRGVYNDSVAKQLVMLESGKSPKPAEAPLLSCLAELNSKLHAKLESELTLLASLKKSTKTIQSLFPAKPADIEELIANNGPGVVSLELDPESPLEPCDYLAMMRLCEEAAGGIRDLEAKCKPYLPAAHMYSGVRQFAAQLIGQEDMKHDLDKREQKLLSRMTLPDYSKIGCVEKYRPLDVTALYRFFGERIIKTGDVFTRCMWGHVFRKFSSHPSFLVSMSKNWVIAAGLSQQSTTPHLPIDLATAVWAQQQQNPALKFRAQYMYTSSDHARQAWKTDYFVPSMRLFPIMGQVVTEDLAASILVDGYWAKLHLAPSDSVHDESFWRGVRAFVKEMTTLRDSNMDGLLVRLVEAFPRAIPLEAEKKADAAEAKTETANETAQQDATVAAQA